MIRPIDRPTWDWGLIVDTHGGGRIVPGTYETSWTYQSAGWRVNFSGEGRMCEITGKIVTHSFDFIPQNLALKNFRASFEQRCQGASAALKGEVAILADPWR